MGRGKSGKIGVESFKKKLSMKILDFILFCRVSPYYRFIFNKLPYSTKRARDLGTFRMFLSLALLNPHPAPPTTWGQPQDPVESRRKSYWIFFWFGKFVLKIFALPRNITPKLVILNGNFA